MTPETAAAAWQQMEAIRQQRWRDALGLDDIVQRLRDRAYSGKIPDALSEQAAREIERLRLTDAEREAARFCVTASLPETGKLGGVAGELCRMHAATLRGLLERLG